MNEDFLPGFRVHKHDWIDEVDPTFVIDGYSLYMTCMACPEQYDVYKDGKQVAYLRLRHGTFIVHCPDYGGEIVYVAYPKGDGMFCEDEQLLYLGVAVDAIKDYEKRCGEAQAGH